MQRLYVLKDSIKQSHAFVTKVKKLLIMLKYDSIMYRGLKCNLILNRHSRNDEKMDLLHHKRSSGLLAINSVNDWQNINPRTSKIEIEKPYKHISNYEHLSKHKNCVNILNKNHLFLNIKSKRLKKQI